MEYLLLGYKKISIILLIQHSEHQSNLMFTLCHASLVVHINLCPAGTN